MPQGRVCGCGAARVGSARHGPRKRMGAGVHGHIFLCKACYCYGVSWAIASRMSLGTRVLLSDSEAQLERSSAGAESSARSPESGDDHGDDRPPRTPSRRLYMVKTVYLTPPHPSQSLETRISRARHATPRGPRHAPLPHLADVHSIAHSRGTRDTRRTHRSGEQGTACISSHLPPAHPGARSSAHPPLSHRLTPTSPLVSSRPSAPMPLNMVPRSPRRLHVALRTSTYLPLETPPYTCASAPTSRLPHHTSIIFVT